MCLEDIRILTARFINDKFIINFDNIKQSKIIIHNPKTLHHLQGFKSGWMWAEKNYGFGIRFRRWYMWYLYDS